MKCYLKIGHASVEAFLVVHMAAYNQVKEMETALMGMIG